MHAKVWKCKFRYSGVCKMHEVWGEGGGDPYHGGGGGGGGNMGHGTIPLPATCGSPLGGGAC